MRLERLCTLELAFEGPLDVFREDGRDGRIYGVGGGIVSGDRISGSIRWTNHPRIRADGTTLPDLHGVITLADGANVGIEMHGISTALADGVRRDTRTSATFVAGAEAHRWLNDIFCVCEGAFDAATGRSTFAVHECLNELT